MSNPKTKQFVEIARAPASCERRLVFSEVEPGRFKIVPITCSIAELKGMFGKANRAVSPNQMNEAISRAGRGDGLS